MKIQEAAINQKTWGANPIQAGFSEKDLPKLMGLMSGGLYKDAYSWIPEIVQNAIDIHKKVKTNKKVFIGFDNDKNGAYLYVEDFGTGISIQLMNDYVSKFGASTKDDSDNYIGGLGIGFFSLNRYSQGRSYIVTTVDKTEYTYLLTKENGSQFIPISILPTYKENGTIIKVYYGSLQEENILRNEILKKVVYFEGLHYKGFTDPLVKHDTFWYSSSFTGKSELHINYAGYYYQIPWDSIGMKPIKICAALPIDIGTINVTPNREEIIIEKKTVDLIKHKIKLFLDHCKTIVPLKFTDFQKYYNAESFKTFTTDYGMVIYYELLGLENSISFLPLLPLKLPSIIPILEHGLHGQFRRYRHHDKEYRKFACYYGDSKILSNKYFGEFMKGRCIITLPSLKLKDYIRFLELKKHPRESWRSLIELYNNWFIKEFNLTSFTEAKESKEYKDYLLKNKKSIRGNSDIVRRKKVNYVARWTPKNTVTWDTHIVFSPNYITVTKNTPKDTVEFLYSLVNDTSISLLLGKTEDYEWIEKNKVTAEVYWGIKINDLLESHKWFFDLCTILKVKYDSTALKSYSKKCNISWTIEKKDFLIKLEGIVNTNKLKVLEEIEYEKVQNFIKKYEYIYEMSLLSNREHNREHFQFIHNLIQTLNGKNEFSNSALPV